MTNSANEEWVFIGTNNVVTLTNHLLSAKFPHGYHKMNTVTKFLSIKYNNKCISK